ncbi:cysteine desulfurase family protein [Paenibacillus sp. OK003]|uniref:cysteine desulfurase family protein n=1 Tax=Paenibacillus sp. OK003 TaxID=1884380 RepID=UPI0008CC5378|nr:cysteine desulfurase family protein [Paenibacillus sp. OK003]SEK71120.1 cysteine desulfurase [Paenibacillus sp. OK003]
MKRIYLDHAASTPMHPQVAEAMIKVMTGQYGNASSIHAFGREAKRTVSGARDVIAASLGCFPDELVFTGGGTESDNLAIFGAVSARKERGRHIITTAIEHHAVLHTCQELERQGYDVTYLPVDEYGRIRLEELKDAIRPDTVLITMMYANNEVGTIQPIREIGELARQHDILFHTDAVQALGTQEISCKELPVDLISFSAHKINGPQGVGALYVRRGITLEARAHGGLQERQRRAGTENIAGIAGFAEALKLSGEQAEVRLEHDLALRSLLLEQLEQHVGLEHFHVNGHPEYTLPNILNISFPEVSTETMLMNLDMEGIAVASGSACTSGSLEVSHVLKAMKLPETFLHSAIRFSWGLGNTSEEIMITAEKIGTILGRLRNRA